jgi:predicted outer membrane lipoprotein
MRGCKIGAAFGILTALAVALSQVAQRSTQPAADKASLKERAGDVGHPVGLLSHALPHVACSLFGRLIGPLTSHNL